MTDIDLGEFVSDYVRTIDPSPDKKHYAADIAAAYVDATLEGQFTEHEVEVLIHQTTQQVGYYL